MLRFALAAGLMALAACAAAPSSYQLQPLAANGQDLTKIAGLKPGTLLESRMPGGTVVVRTVDIFSDYGASFAIAATNAGGAPASFGVQNISATAGSGSLHIYTPEELDGEIKGAAREFLRAADPTYDPSQRRDIEQASSQANRAENFNTFVGCPVGEGRCQIDSSDLGSSYRLERMGRQDSVATSEEVALKLASELPAVTRVLRDSTIAPNATAGGLVVMQHPSRGQQLTLVIDFGGQKHTFSFEAAPKG